MRKPHGPSVALALLCLAGVSPSWAQDVALRDGHAAPPALAMRPALDDSARPDYVLGTGDKVRVIVYGEDDLGGNFQIDAKGFVQLPLVGAITASGGTPHDLATRFENALTDGYVLSPKVSVEVLQYRPFYVIGEVAKPGQYDYVNEMSVPNAIALAGGFTIKAVNSWIYVRHARDSVEHRVPADETTKIEPGDVLRVPDTAFWSVMDVLSPITSMGSYIPKPY